jgi:hypothetical protein
MMPLGWQQEVRFRSIFEISSGVPVAKSCVRLVVQAVVSDAKHWHSWLFWLVERLDSPMA